MPDFSKIQVPTLLLDEEKARSNIRRMAEKARKSGVTFRPHFKTHQSRAVGRWFRDEGVDKITVSSLRMASYFAGDGWKDITVAFPVNLREISLINGLAEQVRLNLLLDSVEAARFLGRNLRHRVGIFIKVDVGYGRCGLTPEDLSLLWAVLAEIGRSRKMEFRGFLTHAGQTYHVLGREEIRSIYRRSVEMLKWFREQVAADYPEAILSYGDTPSCSLVEDLSDLDEIRPGNFVFYDLTQWSLGVCEPEDIAIAVACPVAGKYPRRREIVLYGGAVHLSKEQGTTPQGDSHFGLLADWTDNGWEFSGGCCALRRLSQEHGVLSACERHFPRLRIGDLVAVLPVHSCLTADLAAGYVTLDGRFLPKFPADG